MIGHTHSGGSSGNGGGSTTTPTPAPQQKQQSSKGNGCDPKCHADRAKKSLLTEWAKEDAQDAIGMDVVNLVLDTVNLAITSLLSTPGLVVISRILQVVGSVLPHALQLIGDIIIAQTGQIPAWLQTAMVVAGQVATAANFVNGALAFLDFGLSDEIGIQTSKVLRGPLMAMIASFSNGFASSITLSQDERRFDRLQLENNNWSDDYIVQQCTSSHLSSC